MKLLYAIGACILYTLTASSLLALSVTEEGYNQMIKNITCYQVIVENSTDYPINIQTIKLAPKQRAMVYEQCLDQYERLSRTLGYIRNKPITLDIDIKGIVYPLLNIEEGILSQNYNFNVVQDDEGIIWIEEQDYPEKYQALPSIEIPEPPKKESLPDIRGEEPEFVDPGEPVAFQ